MGRDHACLSAEALGRREPDSIARGATLPFRNDAPGIAHLAAEEILEKRVAVESSAVLPDLHDPRPHRFRRRRDLDGMRHVRRRTRRKRISRQRRHAIQMRRAPVQVPRAHPHHVQEQNSGDDRRGNGGSQHVLWARMRPGGPAGL
jgi:hypothetical protein